MSELTRYISPLFNFLCEASFRIADDLRISEQSELPDLDQQLQVLSKIERENCERTKRWLVLDHDKGRAGLSEAEIMNLFLMASWIAGRFPMHIAFRFVPRQPEQAVRLLDRFQRLGDGCEANVSDSELELISKHLSALREAMEASPRLKAAGVLTLAGCTAHFWQVSFVCFSSAAEALLSYQDGPGLAERLKYAYASLVTQRDDQRSVLKEDFYRLYKVRSEIVHEGAYERNNGENNLGDLAEFGNLLRRLWQAVLDDSEISLALQGDNSARMALIEKRQGLPPVRPRKCCH